jgi:hypothetical protein
VARPPHSQNHCHRKRENAIKEEEEEEEEQQQQQQL